MNKYQRLTLIGLSEALAKIDEERALIVEAIEDELSRFGDDEMVEVMERYGIEL